jgi:hypothetical protein
MKRTEICGVSEFHRAKVSMPSRGHERFLPNPYSVTIHDIIPVSYVIVAVETS